MAQRVKGEAKINSKQSVVVSAHGLLERKLLVAFLLGFFGWAAPRLLDILNIVNSGGDPHLGRSLLLSLLAGAIAAGVRAVLALSPINLVPDDKLHTLRGKTTSVKIEGREP